MSKMGEVIPLVQYKNIDVLRLVQAVEKADGQLADDIQALDGYEQLRADVREKTSATLGGLGAVELRSTAIENWLANVEMRGALGPRR
jgi:hypothetical protein